MSNKNKCRACLTEGAKYPIFENIESDESIYSKLSQCLNENIEDIEGYPNKICESCKTIIDTVHNFINKFKMTCKILENGIIVKQEMDIDNEPNQQIEIEIVKVEPESDSDGPDPLEDDCKEKTEQNDKESPITQINKREKRLLEIRAKIEALKQAKLNKATSTSTSKTKTKATGAKAKPSAKRTAYNRTMEKQPDEPEDFTNEPLPSMSEPMVVQDAVASTLATPFAQPINAASKSKAQKQREYRQRIASTRTPAQVAAARKSKNERQRNNRLRQAANMAIASGSLEATTTSSNANGVAEPITAAPKTRAQIQHEYRQRIAASKTPAQAAAAREARNVRDRNNRLRQAANLAIASGSLEATTTSSSRSGQRLNTVHIDTQRQFTDQQRQTLATEPAESTVQPSTSSDQIEVQAQSTWNTKWASSIMRFKSTF